MPTEPTSVQDATHQPPRKRGCLSWCWRWGWRSVLVLVVLYLGLAVYYSTGSPKVTVDYAAKTNEHAAAVPEQDRAWPVYREALLAMGLEDRRDNPNAELLKDGELPEDAGWEAAAEYVSAHADAVAQLRVAAGMPGMGYIADFGVAEVDREIFPGKDVVGQTPASAHPSDQTVISLLLPHLGMLRQASRVLSVDAHLAAEQGDAQRCLADLLAMLQMGPHADEQVLVISQLVHISLNAQALQTISRVVCDYPELLDDAQLAALADAVAAIDGFTLDYAGERMMFDDIVQHLYTDNGRGNGHFAIGSGQGMTGTGPSGQGAGAAVMRFLLAPVVALGSASRRDLTEAYHELMDINQAQADLPRGEVTEADFEDILAGYEDSVIRRHRYRLMLMLVPALSAARNTADRCEDNAQAAQVGIALELYHRANGNYPDTLDAMVPEYLDAVPNDPIAGGPLRYRVGDAGPVLYSVGADGDDDGGRAPGKYGPYPPPAEAPAGVPAEAPTRPWIADQYAGARWNEPDPADGDWVLWPQHDPPVMPEPE